MDLARRAILGALGIGLALLPLRPGTAHGDADPLGAIRQIPSPAAPRSGEPCLAVAPDGAVWMSWFEKRDPRGFALRVARLDGARWSRPSTVAAGDSFFVNWADFPHLAALGGGRLAISWPWKHGGGDPYAYDVRVAFTADGGETWSRPVMPNRDGTASEHGFVSMVPAGDGVQVLWLDGRKYGARKPEGGGARGAGSGGEMTLRGAWLGPDGAIASEAEIDGRTCDCCNTAAVVVPGGALVAYRDRSAREIRDISVARSVNGRWSPPATVHADGWRLSACPVNGPALDGAGSRVVVAWFTMIGDTAAVQAAFSADGGRSFGRPVRVGSGEALGRCDVVLLDDGTALVSWLEALGSDALVRVRHVAADAPRGSAVIVGRTSAARESGFPRMVRSGRRAIFAWTEAGSTTRVRVVAADIR